jgi:VWFA-related protein
MKIRELRNCGALRFWAVLALTAGLAGGGPLEVLAQSDGPAAPVIRNNVRLVSLDVIVTDKDGRPARDLKPEDFALTENGVSQRVLHVEAHLVEANSSATGNAFHPGAGASNDIGSVQFTNKPTMNENAWNVILLDALDSSTGDQAQARKDLWKFIKTLPAEQPIALATMDPSLRILTTFQNGAGAVNKLLATTMGNPKFSPMMEAYNQDDQDILEHIEAKMQDRGAGQQSAMQSEEMARLSIRVQTVFSNFDALADWLGKYPGKKNVFWLSTGFPLIGVPTSFSDGKTQGAENFRGRFAAEQSDLDRRMQLARIAIFPIDTRGTLGEFPGMQDATHNSGRYVGSAGSVALAADMDNASFQQTQEVIEERTIAEDTGGVAKYNSNDIDGMLRSAYGQGQNFYTLSYSPENKKWDGRYRNIDIKLKQRGYHLAYRRGYFAIDTPEKTPTTDEFSRALRRNSPPSRGVLFTAKLKKTADTIVLDYTVDAHTLQFATDDNGRTAAVDCAVVEYDRIGKVLGTTQIRVAGKVKPAQWSRVEEAGFPAHQVVPLVANAASITIGIRDHASGEFGNMEVALAQ